MNRLTILPIQFTAGSLPNTIYPVIVSDETEMVLIDCGYPGFFPLLTSTAAAAGLDCSKLTKIIITHHDYDHMGALAEFKQAYPHVQVIASCEDEPYIAANSNPCACSRPKTSTPHCRKSKETLPEAFSRSCRK